MRNCPSPFSTRIISFFIILLLNIQLLFAHENIQLTKEEQEWLNSHREITFVSQTDYAPFEFVCEQEESAGMSIELARWIATETGFKACFIDMPFLEAQKAILSGEADVLTSFFYSQKRDEAFNFTPLVWEVPALIFIPADRPDIKDLNDLKGKTIAMQRGDYAADFLKSKNIDYTLFPVDSFFEATQAVINGQADALIGDKQRALYSLYNNNQNHLLKSVDDALYTGQNCMATREDNLILQSILDKGVQKALKTGVVSRIENTWLGISYEGQPESVFEEHINTILGFLAVLTVLFLGIVLWNRQLRSLVNKKTRELNRNEIQLKTIFNTIPDLIWIKDPQGHYMGCNPEFEKLFGNKEEEIIGKSDIDFVSLELANVFRENDLKAIEAGRPRMNEERVTYASDGHEEILETTKTPYYDEKGELIGVLGIAHSVSERVRSEQKIKESEAFLSSIIENIPDIVCVKDAETLQYIRTNRAAEDFFDCHNGELIGKNADDCFSAEIAANFVNLNRELLSSGKTIEIFDFEIVNAADEERTLHLKMIPVLGDDNEILYILEISKDITEQKKIEKLLHVQRDLGMALSEAVSLDQAINECLMSSLKISGVTSGGIYLINEKNGNLELVDETSFGLPESFVKYSKSYTPDSNQFQMVQAGNSIFVNYPDLVNSIKNMPAEEKAEKISCNLKAVGIIPIKNGDKVIGCINIASTKLDRFPKDTEYSLESIVTQTSLALERIMSNEQLEKSRQNFQSLFDSIDDFLFILGEDGAIRHWNPTVEERLGYKADQLFALNVTNLHPPEKKDAVRKIVREMLDGERNDCPIPLKTNSGGLIPVETRVNTGLWNGKPAIFGVSRDISERIKAYKEKEQIEETLEAAIDAIDEGFAIFDRNDKLIFSNAKFGDAFPNLNSESIQGKSFEELLRLRVDTGDFPEAAENPEIWIHERLSQHRMGKSDIEQKLKDGRWIRSKESRMKDGGTVGFRLDITKTKATEKHIRKALQEKEILLKEIHHRVKNNLQVVISLLGLQLDKLESQTAIDALMEAENRVRSMSLVHEVLYQSSSLNEIDLQDYLDKLKEHTTYLYAHQNVDIQVKANGVSLNISQAVPCGLIISELITNSMKHAFTEMTEGALINIEINKTDDNRIIALVEDNGKGFPGQIVSEKIDTIGLRLVIDLIEDQLDGTWSADQGKGLRWNLEWPAIKEK